MSAHFVLVRAGRVLYATHDLCLVKLTLFDKLFDTLRICIRIASQSLQIPGLSRSF
jgi:hypothetical protein